jgi:hypothetical protein
MAGLLAEPQKTVISGCLPPLQAPPTPDSNSNAEINITKRFIGSFPGKYLISSLYQR